MNVDPDFIEEIREVLSSEAIKKSLCEYFDTREVSLDEPLYPPVLREMMEAVPPISDKVEVIPHIENIDPTSGSVKMGWNMFVFGTRRMFLGYSVHESMEHLERQVLNSEGLQTSIRYATPNDVIDFIIDEIDNRKASIMPNSDPEVVPGVYSSKLPVSAAYYERNKSVGHKLM